MRFNCRDRGDGIIEDVFDSERYKEIDCAYLPPAATNSAISRLTIQINIDGVKVSNSSKSSLYPLMISFNEV